MPFSLASICTEETWRKRLEREKVNSNTEPTSVLHMRRSPTPSPPTSASTLSSSAANGGAFATDAAAAEKKEEWANELQPILVGAHHDRCAGGGGLGLEDWGSMWPDPSTTSAVPEQSLLRWVAGGEMDEGSLFGLKHLLQTGNAYPNNSNSSTHLDFEGNVLGLGILDQGSVLDPIGNLFSSSGSGYAPSGFNGNVKMDPNFEPLASHGGDSSGLGIGNIGNNTCNVPDSNFSNLGVPVYHQQMQQSQFGEEKPHIVGTHQLPVNQNPNFFMPLPYNHQEQHHVLQPPLKRLNSSGSDSQFEGVNINMGFGTNPLNMQFVPPPQQETQFQQQQQQPLMVARQKLLLANGENKESFNRQQQTILDQLYRAAELVGTGNFSHAQGILARLNHQLSPVGKQPLHRAAYYFKDALQHLLLLMNPNNSPAGANPLPRTLTPFDVIFKMGAFKVFSDISPITQFVNFTGNQAIFEALDSNNNAGRIHIVDFDIGFGVQWASFIQELAVLRSKGSPALRITAFASLSIELALTRDNLTQFASEAGIDFELEVVNFEFVEQQSVYDLPRFKPNEDEFVAVNLPVWCSSGQSVQLHSLIRFVKHLSPKIVVCLDKNCERSDLPFPQHILHSLQSYINLLESLDAANASSDAVNKIERFILQPMIESTVLGRMMMRNSPGKLPHWKTLLASAGFSPANFSGFAESQADCLVKRSQTRGFHIEKRQCSLVLCWMRRELVSASVWKC